jgi:hypothetical protein
MKLHCFFLFSWFLGIYSNAPTPIPYDNGCPIGYFKSTNTTNSYSSHYTSEFQFWCVLCAGGSYSPAYNNDQHCISCELGKYTSGCDAVGSCTSCGPGLVAWWMIKGSLFTVEGHKCEGFYKTDVVYSGCSNEAYNYGNGPYYEMEERCSCYLEWGGLSTDGAKAFLACMIVFFVVISFILLNQYCTITDQYISYMQTILGQITILVFCALSFMREISGLVYSLSIPIYAGDIPGPLNVILWIFVFMPSIFFGILLFNKKSAPAWYWGAPPDWVWFEESDDLKKVIASSIMCLPWILLNSPWLVPTWIVGYILYVSKLLSFKGIHDLWFRIYTGEKSIKYADLIDRKQLNIRCLTEIVIIVPVLILQVINSQAMYGNTQFETFNFTMIAFVLFTGTIRFIYYHYVRPRDKFQTYPLGPGIFTDGNNSTVSFIKDIESSHKNNMDKIESTPESTARLRKELIKRYSSASNSILELEIEVLELEQEYEKLKDD